MKYGLYGLALLATACSPAVTSADAQNTVQTKTVKSQPVNRVSVVAPDAYVGRKLADKIEGTAFLDHPLIRAAVEKVVPDANIQRLVLESRDGPTPTIWRMNGNVVAAGCDKLACDTHRWAVVYDPRSGTARVCYMEYDNQLKTRWYSDAGVQNVGAETCPFGEDDG